MTIAPLGQHTYDGCLIRALCVCGEGGKGCVEGGRLTGACVSGRQIPCSQMLKILMQ